MADPALKALISHSHRDKRMREALETHLTMLRRQGKLATWSGRLIGAGEPLDETISEALEAADIVLMMVSADFIASEYCYGVEMRAGLEGHAAETKRDPDHRRRLPVAGCSVCSAQGSSGGREADSKIQPTKSWVAAGR